MRPISLEITGLHSFRERRIIDFEPLLRDNLFGIFGPTGGGKSTILDAMTLALFGKIERTKGQEIASAINAREKECAVAFTFAVRQEGEERRYRVERMYKLQKSGMKSEARLIDLSADPPLPLADKTSEVSGRVEELLGIRAHDFRLSVVLPQGAFAEFLHLRPKERGEMLQRIFGLEELGYRINNRLRELRAALDSARTGLQAKLESLKDYNDEALEARRRELEQATAHAGQSRTRAAEAEAARDDAEALYELVSERNRLLEGEEERKEDRERLERLRAELKRSREAATLEAAVEGARQADARLEEAAKACRKAEAERTRAAENIAPLRKRKEWAEREKGEDGRLIALEEQIRGLEGIAEIDERLRPLLRSVAERGKRIVATQARLEGAQVAIGRSREIEGQAGADLEGIRGIAESLEKETRELERKLGTAERVELLARRREEKEKLLKDAVQEEKELSRQLELLEAQIGTAKDQEGQRTAEREKERRQYEEACVGDALSQALPLLREGEPCPLCGATDHPHPHSPEARHDISSLSSLLQKAEEALTAATARLRELEKEESSLAARIAAAARRSRELEEEVRQHTGEITQMTAETGYGGETDTATLRGLLEKISGRLARKKEDYRNAKEKITSLEAALKNAADTVAAAKEELARLRQTIASEEEELGREEKELQEIRSRREERLRLIGLEAAEGESGQRLAERKEEQSRLKKEIAEIEEAFEKGQAALLNAEKECDRLLALKLRDEQETERRTRERDRGLKEKGFDSIKEWREAVLDRDEQDRREQQADALAERLNEAERRMKELVAGIGERNITAEELSVRREAHAQALQQREEALTALGKAEQAAAECETRNAEWKKVVQESERTGREYEAMRKLSGYLQGNAFINFLADERLQQICRTASGELRELTGGRLEIGSRSDEGFFIRDNGNGGAERPPGSLSGGETFLVSLALSLALSDSLQVGRSPMEFFFLDEGFGTLDDDLLEIVLDSLERLRGTSHRAIGVISHVPQLRERISRRLIVTSASEAHGTDVRLEVS